MQWKTKFHPLIVLCLFATGSAGAAVRPASLGDAAREVITWIEANDPSTQSDKDGWDKIRKALETAGQEAESEAGLKLSLSRILEHWNGKAFRLIDANDPQEWALHKGDAAYPDSGATYQARGTKWTVQYVGRYGKKHGLRRGDSIKTEGFDPIRSASGKKDVEIEVQGSPMSAARKLKIGVHPQPFDAYVLAETQAAGTMLTHNQKSICLQKAWFWLNDAVNAHLLSRINFQTANCVAQMIDLRDAFGQDASGALKFSKKIPTVVLINGQTREGAVRLAKRLKQDLNARIVGETSAMSNLPEKQLSLKALPWTLVAYAGYGAPVEPDEVVKDSLVYAEGMDQVYEQGLRWLTEQVKK